MKEIIIGTKELQKNIKMVKDGVALGNTYVVVSHTTPIFKISPCNLNSENKKYSLGDLKNFRFKSKIKDLSKTIDDVVYNKK